jgi:hypothetical protein
MTMANLRLFSPLPNPRMRQAMSICILAAELDAGRAKVHSRHYKG